MLLEDYLQNPCRMSSLPYWKAIAFPVPDDMLIVHDEEFSEELLLQYNDETYFRVLHDLQWIQPAVLPAGFSLAAITDQELADHIELCYGRPSVSVKDIQDYRTHKVYDENLWIAVKENSSGTIAATGIAERDPDAGEGMLEWVQVSPAYHRKGLGSYIVNELLKRLQNSRFVTVSGKCDHLDHPEALYRQCGFQGKDIWHILRRKKVEP